MATLKKPLAAALGAAFLASSVVPLASAAGGNPFAAQPLKAGYDLPNYTSHEEGGCGAKKEGEGSCGGAKAEGEGKDCEGKTGEDKVACEGKCGEGKCGGDKKAEGEGKCGEGKCGGQ